MNDELAAIAGTYGKHVGMLHEKVGMAGEKTVQHRDDFDKIFEELKRSNARLVELQARRKTGKRTTKRSTTTSSSRRRRRPPEHR